MQRANLRALTMAEQWRAKKGMAANRAQNLYQYVEALAAIDGGASFGDTDLGPIIIFSDGSFHLMKGKVVL